MQGTIREATGEIPLLLLSASITVKKLNTFEINLLIWVIFPKIYQVRARGKEDWTTIIKRT